MSLGDESGERRGRALPVKGWKIRFDSPPASGPSRRAERGNILALFKAWDGVTDREVDRRESPRYTPAESRVWVGWWKGTRFRIIHAELVNLSQGGALVHLAGRPPSSQPVWICVGSPHPMDYVQARVLDSSERPSGSFRVRLEFHSPCPTAFFFAAGYRPEIPPETDTA